MYNHFGQAWLGFHLDVGRAGNRGHDTSHLLSSAVNLIKIFAEYFDGDLSPYTRKNFFDPFREEWLDCEIHAGKLHEHIADLGLNRFRFFPTQRN